MQHEEELASLEGEVVITQQVMIVQGEGVVSGQMFFLRKSLLVRLAMRKQEKAVGSCPEMRIKFSFLMIKDLRKH